MAPIGMQREGQAFLLEEFYQAVTNGASVGTTCQDNIRSLAVVFDVVKSFQTGQRVRSSS